MAEGKIEKTLKVPFEALWSTLIKYEDYPDFVAGVQSVEVNRLGPGKARCKYKVNVIKVVEYELELTEDKEKGILSWSLLSSDLFKSNQGAWELKKISDTETHVHYRVDVEFKISVPSFMLKPLVKSNLPSMIDGFEKRALGK